MSMLHTIEESSQRLLEIWCNPRAEFSAMSVLHTIEESSQRLLEIWCNPRAEFSAMSVLHTIRRGDFTKAARNLV
jgi:hypothetical protein